MTHHVIEFDQECKSCNSTGLYVGLAEQDGAAVVCRTCKGMGHHKTRFEYDDFVVRHRRDQVLRVFEVNPGIYIGIGRLGEFFLSDFGGIAYEDWLDGKAFPRKSESRKFTCPAWWYQSANSEKKPQWDECIGCGSFSTCKYFLHKDGCWDRWDKEFTK